MTSMKKIFYLILVFLGVLTLAGCGVQQDVQITIVDTPLTQLTTLAVETPSPTAARVTQTPMPTSTQYNPTTAAPAAAKPTNMVTPTVVFENRVIIFKDLGPFFYILDITRGNGRLLQTSGEIVYDIFRWDEGCSIIARMESGIAEINLRGEIVHPIFSYEQLPESPEGDKGWLLTSPDEHWLSYRLGIGEFHEGFDPRQSRHDLEYLLILSIDGKQGPYQVSSGGSTIIWAWSPDSQRVAFGDVDEAGIHQVYTVNPDGSQRRQLTHLDFDSNLEGLQWSPDGSKLAIEYWLTDDGSMHDILVVRDEEHLQADLYQGLHLFWWKDEDTLLVFEDQGDFKGVIKQLDVNTRQMIGSAEVHIGWRHFIPFGSRRKVGFLNYDEYLSVYDTDRHTVIVLPNINYKNPEMRNYLEVPGDMIISPDSFPGESECPGWER